MFTAFCTCGSTLGAIGSRERREGLRQQTGHESKFVTSIPYHHVKMRPGCLQVTELMHARAKERCSVHQHTPSMLHAPWGCSMLATGPAPWATMVRSKAAMLRNGLWSGGHGANQTWDCDGSKAWRARGALTESALRTALVLRKGGSDPSTCGLMTIQDDTNE